MYDDVWALSLPSFQWIKVGNIRNVFPDYGIPRPDIGESFLKELLLDSAIHAM